MEEVKLNLSIKINHLFQIFLNVLFYNFAVSKISSSISYVQKLKKSTENVVIHIKVTSNMAQ